MRISTGCQGLDIVLGGGLPANRMYMVQGEPGVGKTTLAMQFLLAGAAAGERGLYVTLSETREELMSAARSHDWSFDGIDIHEMSVSGGVDAAEEDENTLYVPGEVELGARMERLLAEVDRVEPSRIVLDSCTELRLLAQSPLRFRRQVLALKEDLIKRHCTVILIENPANSQGDVLLQSLVHGVIVMEQLSVLFGAERRRLRINKLREVAFSGGFHDLTIRKDGVTVFPRLVAAGHRAPFERSQVSSGLAAVDKLVGGGLDRGTATLIIGPAGTAKSVLGTQFATTSAAAGEKVAMFTFDEGSATMFARSDALGCPLRAQVDKGTIRVQQIDPAELSPGEFVHIVRQAVERDGARMIVIDSLNGYLHAMPQEEFLSAQLHELLAYLRQLGVVVIMIVAQQGMLGTSAPVDVSYLADNVILTRFFEAGGRVRKAISVLKRRTGEHEDTIREVTLGRGGMTVSEPLTQFRGVLTGVPEVLVGVRG